MDHLDFSDIHAVKSVGHFYCSKSVALAVIYIILCAGDKLFFLVHGLCNLEVALCILLPVIFHLEISI